MSETAESTAVEDGYRRLDEITAAIKARKDDLGDLYAQRRVVFDRLLAAGQPQAVIARRAGLTSQAVAFSVHGNPKRAKREQ